jgi:hypothetical protein
MPDSPEYGTLGCMHQDGDPPTVAQISPAAQAALRLTVARFRACQPRHTLPPVVHVGLLGGMNEEFVELREHRLDQSLRTEVMAALLSRAQVGLPRQMTSPTTCPITWLTRTGQLDPEDVDLRWYAAARAAYGEAGVPLAMVVVTKSGWYDPRTGTRREWKRLRIRT